ncbi:DUF5050 domain-containing protein [Paenibacillus chondroitinus]|uniref:DUF5050 domain-containing protein n=1 Tax=Paenibacillus chondroitinus TaxID=59842 RepID=A0ABU6DK26_9BACL|nr:MULTISPECIES: DUF5050 domain-containing protein [Paenibacillus]MCY9658499.1 DUF5050 domain-containing protein [Paenibacillus anseongense]MEB4797211.1 DUF5050 domain-containing protein [Paenibacillus chondroitinus]
MRKKLFGYSVVFSLCMSLLMPAGSTQAADDSVRVTLPDFEVNLNGHKVENQFREYPLLVYRDITYFPMTWYDTRLLGLEAKWSPDEGLNIKQNQVTSSYVPYNSDHRNAAIYTAEVPASTVTINGKEIDNTKEKYPLLSFRDVTYFPMTWRFAHDDFRWDYNWDNTSGLSITSHNPQMNNVGLPTYAGENDVALFKGYYYFVETTDTTNHVYRAPVQQPSNKEEIYSYNVKTYQGLQKDLSFQIRDNTLWFTYHHGGAIMGGDGYVKIADDGKAEILHDGYLDFRDTKYGTLIVQLGASVFEGGNLYLLPPGLDETNHMSVGDPGVKYGAHATYNGGEGYSADSSTTVIGDDVYVLASRDQSDANKIYKINLKTNKSTKIVDTSVNWFRIINNKLYYVKDKDKVLYSSALDGAGEMKLSEHAVSWFDSINGNVFYTTKKENNLYELYKADSNEEDPLVWTTPVVSIQVLNGQLVCKLHENDDYGLALLDASGSLVLEVADPISGILTSDNGVLIKSLKDSSYKFIR